MRLHYATYAMRCTQEDLSGRHGQLSPQENVRNTARKYDNEAMTQTSRLGIIPYKHENKATMLRQTPLLQLGTPGRRS